MKSERKPSVVLIEDNVDLAHSTQLLMDEVFAVSVAHTGLEGLQLIVQTLPDIVLIDLGLPDIDGFALIKRLRDEMNVNIPVLAFSGSETPEERIRAFAEGFDDFLGKPVDPKTIIEKILVNLQRSPKHAKQLRILVIEDNEDMRAILEFQLRGMGYEVVSAADGKTAIEVFKNAAPDLVLSDIMLPDYDGYELCRLFKSEQSGRFVPIMLLTARSDIQGLVKAFEAGADDYLTKPYREEELTGRLKSLRRILELTRVLKLANDDLLDKTQQLKEALASEKRVLKQLNTKAKKLQELSITDDLTALYNHRYFKEHLDREFTRSKRFSAPLSLMMLDVNAFKSINDVYGHQAGDFCLKAIAGIVLKTIRNIDFAARYGGDEFVVLLPNTNDGGAHILAERIVERVKAESFAFKEHHLDISVSIGVATLDRDIASAEALLDAADFCMYHAKKSGKNQIYTQSRRPFVFHAPEQAASLDTYIRELQSVSKRTFISKLQNMVQIAHEAKSGDGFSLARARRFVDQAADLLGVGTEDREMVFDAYTLYALGFGNTSSAHPLSLAFLDKVSLLSVEVGLLHAAIGQSVENTAVLRLLRAAISLHDLGAEGEAYLRDRGDEVIAVNAIPSSALKGVLEAPR